jgi:hypothetical protein
MKKSVDIPVALPQYLVLIVRPTLGIGPDSQRGKAPTAKTPCKGKSSRRKNTSWQPRKRLRRRKRNINRVARTIPRKDPREIQKASREKHLSGGFLVASRQLLVVSTNSDLQDFDSSARQVDCYLRADELMVNEIFGKAMPNWCSEAAA